MRPKSWPQPVSDASQSITSTRRRSRMSAARRKMVCLMLGVEVPQLRNAACAASIARRASHASPAAMRATTWPLHGSRSSNVRPLQAGTHSPAMNCSKTGMVGIRRALASVAMTCPVGLAWHAQHRRRARGQAVSDRQQLRAETLFNSAPNALRQEQRKRNGGRAEADEVPRAAVGEPVLDREEDDRPDQRTFERAETSDQHHENHVGAVLHTKDRLRLDEQRVGQDECTGRAAAEGCENEQDTLTCLNPDADSRGRDLVVPD